MDMMKMKSVTETIKEIMDKLICAPEDEQKMKEYFFNYLTEDFDYSCFSARPQGKSFIFSKELVIGKQAKILVYDTTNRTIPFLATLILDVDKKWRLQSFWFMCANCFGTGIIVDDPCDVCGVTGWGLVPDSAYEV